VHGFGIDGELSALFNIEECEGRHFLYDFGELGI
jgi:hypothetical protein